jgi:hypothetical protein
MLLTRSATAAAFLALLASVAAVAFLISNQSLRQEVSERQQTINQALALSQINSRLINSLATIAARDNDDQIRAVLAQQGITFQVNPPQAGVSSSQKPPQAKATK